MKALLFTLCLLMPVLSCSQPGGGEIPCGNADPCRCPNPPASCDGGNPVPISGIEYLILSGLVLGAVVINAKKKANIKGKDIKGSTDTDTQQKINDYIQRKETLEFLFVNDQDIKGTSLQPVIYKSIKKYEMMIRILKRVNKATVVLLLLMLIGGTGYAQMRIDKETNTYKYDSVVNAPGISADVLLNNARNWVIKKYPQETIHIDTVKNSIVGVGAYQTEATTFNMGGLLIKFVLVMDFKDGKYRYEIKDFSSTTNLVDGRFTTTGAVSTKPLTPNGTHLMKKPSRQVDQHIKAVIIDLNKAITSNESNDNW